MVVSTGQHSKNKTNDDQNVAVSWLPPYEWLSTSPIASVAPNEIPTFASLAGSGMQSFFDTNRYMCYGKSLA